MENKTKIFVVEDDEFLRTLIVKKFKSAGFLVATSAEGEGSLEKIKKEKPDLILLDIILPGMDGFEVMKLLKEDPNTKDIPVIFLTNLGQEEDLKKGMDLGAEDYLVKAYFTPDEIVKRIQRILTRK